MKKITSIQTFLTWDLHFFTRFYFSVFSTICVGEVSCTEYGSYRTGTIAVYTNIPMFSRHSFIHRNVHACHVPYLLKPMISAFPFRYIIFQLSLVATVILERKLLIIKDAGLVPIYINANSGQFRQYSAVTLGARGDSYYGRIFVFFFHVIFLYCQLRLLMLGSFRQRKAAVAAWRTNNLAIFYPTEPPVTLTLPFKALN
jgi:hypothetical protein